MSNRGKFRCERRQTDWFKRWRTGEYRALLTYLKKHKELPPVHPQTDGLSDLRGANLRKSKLPCVRLPMSCLCEVEMYDAYLEGADLSHSDLLDADLGNANLSNASLASCCLKNANLRKADLAGANLRNADLTGADLTGANLYRANIEDTILSLANLTEAQAIETVEGIPKSAKKTVVNRELLERLDSTALGKLLSAEGDVTDAKFTFDVALSFAGEDRAIAESIASALRSQHVTFFYDKYEKADLWGRNLYDHLSMIYGQKARFCLMLISKHYATKQWTNLERQTAQARAFTENQDYILPVRIDDTEVTGVLGTVGYLRFKDETPLSIARLVKQKLKELIR